MKLVYEPRATVPGGVLVPESEASHQWRPEAWSVACPWCGGENVHLADAENFDGADHYRAPIELRGDLILIPFWTECGHKGNLCFAFHKGTTFFFAAADLDGTIDLPDLE